MKRLYLILTMVGFILPNVFVAKVSLETGNYLLYVDPLSTWNGMFANHISSAFIVDLLFIVILFFVWSYREARKLHLKGVYWVWLFTMAFGIAGGLPLFFLLREKHLESIASVR